MSGYSPADESEIDALVLAAANELGRRLAAELQRMVDEYHMLCEMTFDPAACDPLQILIDATRYLQQRGSSENDALQLLDNAMVRVMREPEMPHALDGTCWCLREYTALDYYKGVVALTGAMEYLDKRGRLDDDALAILHRACQDVTDAWKGQRREQ